MFSMGLPENTVSWALWSCRKSRRRFLRLYWLLLICALLYGMSALTLASAETAQIGIILPTAGEGVKQADVDYARSTSKRLTRMLAGIGLAADTIEEAALLNRDQRSRLPQESARGNIDVDNVPRAQGKKRLLILPMNAEVSPQMADYLKEFVAGGGKLLVTYSLAAEVAQLLHLRQTNWLDEERPGQFASIHLNAPEVQGMPASVRQASWNITVAEPTAPQTKVIGYWHNARGENTNLPALFLGQSGAFFSHVFLPDDIQKKKLLLAALLGHLVPEFRRAIAKKALDDTSQIGHTQQPEALAKFVKRSRNSDAITALKNGQDLVEQARAAYTREVYDEAIATARAGRIALSEAYHRSHTNIAREGRAVWNHSGLGAYPGDWERSAKELADAGINMLIPNMAWAGVAHYPSEFLPPSETFTRYGDQVEQCVQAARQHGLEVHIWKITWNLEGAPREFVEKLRAAGRTQVSANGEPLNWLCPSHPENVKLELNVFLEIVENYDIDGVQLDYIRYPGAHACYCEECRKRFVLFCHSRGVRRGLMNDEVSLRNPTSRQAPRERGKLLPALSMSTFSVMDTWPTAVASGELKTAWTEWRVQQITRLVRLLHKRARQIKPNIKISAAVFGGYPACVTSIGQDWVAWANAGYLDFVCPMNYTEDNTYFTDLLENQLSLLPKGFTIYPGIGATATNSLLTADAVIGQIYLSRFLGAAGWTIFDYSVDTSDTVLPAIGTFLSFARRSDR